MIIGVDTSGKIGQFPVYLGVIRMKKTKTLDEIRKRVGKKKSIFTIRRRIDAKYLNESDIRFLTENIEYGLNVLKSPVFSKMLNKFSTLKEPSIRILASSIYITSKNLVEMNDVILIDKDYDYEKMRFLCSSVNFLFRKFEKVNISVEIGTSYNEAIALADIIASLGRLGKLDVRKITTGELNECMGKF